MASKGMAVLSSKHIFRRFAGRPVCEVFTVSAVGVGGTAVVGAATLEPLTLDIELDLGGGMGVAASI